MSTADLVVRVFTLSPYEATQQAMQDFTDNRTADTLDEVWLLEHEAVFTQGQAGKAEHLLHPSNIPVIQSNRGGQITYHGPGQLIVYFLIDLKRKNLSVRTLVSRIENLCIDLLSQYHIKAYSKADAPGVYVDQQKIASLGLRVRRGCSFHGLALNVNMDLSPFSYINPCGYAGLKMTQISELKGPDSIEKMIKPMITSIVRGFEYQNATIIERNTI